MATLNFPINKQNKYYDFYVSFIKSVFEVAGHKVIIDSTLPDYILPAAFYVKINDKLVFIEMSDFPDEWMHFLTKTGWDRRAPFYDPKELGCPIFKRSMRPDKEYANNVFPMGAFYVANNKDSSGLKKLMEIGNIYNPDSSLILNTNRVWGGAVHTRKFAFANIDNNKLLPEVQFDTRRMNLYQHYLRHGELLASLNISGAHYHSIDIGAPEAMMLGCLVISNDFDILLPYGKRLEKGIDYIQIADDYSDINECINLPYEDRLKAAEIAHNGYDKLWSTCNPTTLVNWFEQIVEEYYA